MKASAMVWSFVSGIVFCRFRASFMFGLTACGARNLIRFGARDRMTGRRARLADTIKQRPHLCSFRFLWRTLSDHDSASTPIFRINPDAIPSRNPLSTFIVKMNGARRPKPSRAVVLIPGLFFISVALGLTAARCLRDQPQRVGGFITAFLLKFCNPIGHSFHHIPRRFSSGSCLNLDDWA